MTLLLPPGPSGKMAVLLKPKQACRVEARALGSDLGSAHQTSHPAQRAVPQFPHPHNGHAIGGPTVGTRLLLLTGSFVFVESEHTGGCPLPPCCSCFSGDVGPRCLGLGHGVGEPQRPAPRPSLEAGAFCAGEGAVPSGGGPGLRQLVPSWADAPGAVEPASPSP